MTADPLADAHEALNAGRWEEARDRFQAALAEQEDSAPAWEGLSWAAWWIGDEQLTFSSRERAFRLHRAAGDTCGAARMAIWRASDVLDFRGEDAVATGWIERARRLVAGHPPCAEHGWISLVEADIAARAGNTAEIVRRGSEAARIGGELGIADLETIGLAYQGLGLVVGGDLEEGMRRLDEASAAADGEEFQLAASPGWALCCVIGACTGVGDFARATQWCGTLRSFVERWGGRHMMGICRSDYGSVLATGGDWPRAEEELLAAVGELTESRPAIAASGVLRLGELRARQGRTGEARALFEEAGGQGMAALGLGQLALEEGDAAAARDAAERYLRRIPGGALLYRVPGLELLVLARAALCELAEAGEAYAELRAAADRIGTPFMTGHADLAGAQLELVRGEYEAARRTAEDAVDRLTVGAAPYDAALARVALAQALGALGRSVAAEAELRAALATFSALGAVRDAARVEELLERGSRATEPGGPGAREGDGPLRDLTARELEVLRLVAQGYSDAEVAERLVVSPHTVHRHVANVRTKLGLPSRAAAVAYAARSGML
jgi:DNA-binding NarL/FixJ family response regulator